MDKDTYTIIHTRVRHTWKENLSENSDGSTDPVTNHCNRGSLDRKHLIMAARFMPFFFLFPQSIKSSSVCKVSVVFGESCRKFPTAFTKTFLYSSLVIDTWCKAPLLNMDAGMKALCRQTRSNRDRMRIKRFLGEKAITES